MSNFVTGVKTEQHFYTWKVENFMEVQKNEKLITEQAIQIDTSLKKSSVPSTWQVGLTTRWESGLHLMVPYCTLMENESSRVAIPIRFRISAEGANGKKAETFLPVESSFRPLQGRIAPFDNFCWTFNQPRSKWNIIQDDGSVKFSIWLTIIKPC